MSDWKNKLNGLVTNAGETGLDKQTAWNKLHERLQEKPSNKKIYWYWLAAACVLLIAGAFWIFKPKTGETGYVKVEVPAQKESIASSIEDKNQITQPAENSSVKNISPEVTATRKISNEPKKNIEAFKPLDTVKKDQPLQEDLVVADIPFPIVNAPKDSSSVVATTNTTTVVKKRLKVVRLNEINTSPEEYTEFNRTQAGSSFKQKNSKSGLFKSSFGNTQSGDEFIKIKLSPQN